MKTIITIELHDGDADAAFDLSSGVDVGTLLRDAFGEFMAARQPVAEYVAKRYTGQGGRFTTWKIREVEKRLKMAELLKRGTFTVERMPDTENDVCLSDTKVTYEFGSADTAADFMSKLQCGARRDERVVDVFVGDDLACIDALARGFCGRRVV